MVKKIVTFPLRIDAEFNREIDEAVFEMKKNGEMTKHQFCLDAIREKVKKTRGEQ